MSTENKIAIETIHWDRRNGFDSYPYPHNASHGWQQCPKCSAVVRVMEVGCDYYSSIERCKCGAVVECPGVIDDGRFSGLHQIFIEAGIESPIVPGEVPENCSESVKAEFDSMNGTEIFG